MAIVVGAIALVIAIAAASIAAILAEPIFWIVLLLALCALFANGIK